jgi:hypothetical protein
MTRAGQRQFLLIPARGHLNWRVLDQPGAPAVIRLFYATVAALLLSMLVESVWANASDVPLPTPSGFADSAASPRDY